MKRLIFLGLSVLAIGCKSSGTLSVNSTADGNWELEFISAPGKTIEDLYPENKPTLQYSAADKRVSGKNGCNSYSGTVAMENGTALFGTAQFISTRMFCPGDGEKTYMAELSKISRYSISEDGKTLTLIMGDIATMRFHRN
ncbi:META domain-containing protein [Flavobacterium silvaticum]|uniref:META domain-containing protein n=1 Tax=Flavobacterium silvaticum TaxID=1852020 RepID=A0A972JEX0_9FLAO|nr:META domain-containing protein [Flavobacterium silvaticum]NMH27344.1 META domain-containing protein [Flavobacterium silvaticum]